MDFCFVILTLATRPPVPSRAWPAGAAGIPPPFPFAPQQSAAPGSRPRARPAARSSGPRQRWVRGQPAELRASGLGGRGRGPPPAACASGRGKRSCFEVCLSRGEALPRRRASWPVARASVGPAGPGPPRSVPVGWWLPSASSMSRPGAKMGKKMSCVCRSLLHDCGNVDDNVTRRRTDPRQR